MPLSHTAAHTQLNTLLLASITAITLLPTHTPTHTHTNSNLSPCPPAPPSPPNRFHLWSANADALPSTIFTVTVRAGDPDAALPTYMKTMKNGDLKHTLLTRGLPTFGQKKDLLERIRTEFPAVRFKIDGRECIQGLLRAGLMHLGGGMGPEHEGAHDGLDRFNVKMPARGPCAQGVYKIRERHYELYSYMHSQYEQQKLHDADYNDYACDRFERGIKERCEREGVLVCWPIPRYFADLVSDDPEAVSPERRLAGEKSRVPNL